MQNNNQYRSVNALCRGDSHGSTISKPARQRQGKTGFLFRGLLFFLIFISYKSIAVADPLTIGVLYPDVPEPYQNIFLNVISGLQSESKGRVAQYVVAKDINVPEIRVWLNKQNINVIIALGRRGLNAATQATDRIPIVSGALLLNPGNEKANVEGISLAADPKVLFSRLLSLVPGIRRVFVVYNPDQNAWIIKLAQQAADAFDIKLVSYTAHSLREAVFHYNEILHVVDPKKDALWLPIDSTTVNDQVVLPLILRAAWDKDLVVFSSNPAHASKGALLSVFPNDEALGRSLAALAHGVESVDSHTQPTVYTLKDLKFAINRRTADHLGLSFSAQHQQKFDFIFPAR